MASMQSAGQPVLGDNLTDEYRVIYRLIKAANFSKDIRASISERAAELVRNVRSRSKSSMMDKFLAQYGLDTKEGVALMRLAEAFLRVPDTLTIDELIEDKVSSGDWGNYLGQSKSSLVNTTTWGLMVAGKLICRSDQNNFIEALRALVKKMGDPMVRTAVDQAMREMGRQFVLGQTIDEALKRAKNYELRGYTLSYDMLGEAARTNRDALRYQAAYEHTISAIHKSSRGSDPRSNPGISVKLSALHPRYEFAQRERVMNELVPRALSLAKRAKLANIGFNIDAEEADRLDLSLDVIEAVLADPDLADWDGFGVVVQAYGKRASHVIDWLYGLASRLNRRIMVRLVKGAYWDAEIKRAQVMGLNEFPVFTRKACSDVSYIACAKKLLNMTDRIYPQFATHNAHSVSAILELAQDRDCFEFQRLYGMGNSLHDEIIIENGTRCRIYVPVGTHHDLLAYLVRRLLENGANSSFVNQIVDDDISPELIARDPIDQVLGLGTDVSSKHIKHPTALFGHERLNSQGWDLSDPKQMNELDAGRKGFQRSQWKSSPMIVGTVIGRTEREVRNPANPEDLVGRVIDAGAEDIDQALDTAKSGVNIWSQMTAERRAKCISRVGDLYEAHSHELFALATREAGKTLPDGTAEIREAIDFARYYALEGLTSETQGVPLGVVVCISPWNFPLAIFTGQVLAALAAGNAVIAKPAEQTSLIAARAIELMYEAGIPRSVVQLLPGAGATVGRALTSDSRVSGVCFTGSTETALQINRLMAETMAPGAPLVAETGGLNAMIVDSTALPEQVVRDVLASSFQSAGQRCSALRMLYIQEDIADHLLEMLFGAMDELAVGDPWLLSTDVGPVIDEKAKERIMAHCDKFGPKEIVRRKNLPTNGLFVSPTVIFVGGIDELEEEVFGPVLHVATFKINQLDQVIDAINAKGFGLTFGLHTRVDSRVNRITNRIKVGNIYVNRNQIGAIVGSQPFGGEGLSGTGPKAGGPFYVRRFKNFGGDAVPIPAIHPSVTSGELQSALIEVRSLKEPSFQDRRTILLDFARDVPIALDIEPTALPGPTGELNVLSRHARGVILCLGPDRQAAENQAVVALSQGNRVIVIAPNISKIANQMFQAGLPIIGLEGLADPNSLKYLDGFDAVTSAADAQSLRAYRVALSARAGPLIPLIIESEYNERMIIERHICIDTTASGGNASLLTQSD